MALYNHLLGKGLAIDWSSGKVQKHFDYDEHFLEIYYFYLSQTTDHSFRLYEAVATLQSRLLGQWRPPSRVGYRLAFELSGPSRKEPTFPTP